MAIRLLPSIINHYYFLQPSTSLPRIRQNNVSHSGLSVSRFSFAQYGLLHKKVCCKQTLKKNIPTQHPLPYCIIYTDSQPIADESFEFTLFLCPPKHAIWLYILSFYTNNSNGIFSMISFIFHEHLALSPKQLALIILLYHLLLYPLSKFLHTPFKVYG